MGMYRFRAQYIDKGDDTDHEVHHENGFLAAKSYTKAMKKIKKWYGGNEYIVTVELTEVMQIMTDYDITDEIEAQSP